MYRAGTVVRAAAGIAVVRAPEDSHPEIGTKTVDEQLRVIGRVVDVFGPVKRPFLAIAPEDDIRPVTLVGEVLYVRD